MYTHASICHSLIVNPRVPTKTRSKFFKNSLFWDGYPHKLHAWIFRRSGSQGAGTDWPARPFQLKPPRRVKDFGRGPSSQECTAEKVWKPPSLELGDRHPMWLMLWNEDRLTEGMELEKEPETCPLHFRFWFQCFVPHPLTVHILHIPPHFVVTICLTRMISCQNQTCRRAAISIPLLSAHDWCDHAAGYRLLKGLLKTVRYTQVLHLKQKLG